jgi:asparagine synthase (glutamine-hydrolysing)
MCGITGFIDFNKNSSKEILSQMVKTLNHRGPDDLGVNLIDNVNYSLGLAQSRLSIIDLSNAGHQPMIFNNLTIVFNGEIYNYKEIRNELIKSGRKFSTLTDTEVILQSFDEWGVDCIHKFNGMFAIVIYDQQINKLYAFRDRAGVKPFYFYTNDNLFLFGSELKSLIKHPGFQKRIDTSVLHNYLNYGYIAAPFTIYRNTSKLMPAHYLEYDLSKNTLITKQYWDLKDSYLKPKLSLSFNEIKNNLKSLMRSAFEYRLVSDVPVGIFLSGGYDSTLVASLLQENATNKLKTFTIGFEQGNNEAPFAKETAKYLGTDHHEYICDSKEAQEIITDLPYYFDEPFADSSAIPTILVSKLAKSEVSVALSADGGDELFCGYNSYYELNKYLSKIKSIPDFIQNGGLKLIKLLNNADLLNDNHNFYQIKTALTALAVNDKNKASFIYSAMKEKPNTYIQKFFSFNIDNKTSSFCLDTTGLQSPYDVAMYMDYTSYLPNDILTKVDRSTMSVSLEGREPFLDHRLAEYVAQIPIKFKYDGITGKKILKDIVNDYVPKSFMDRPKAGFSVPIYSWLRGDLSYLVNEYLSKEALHITGIFNVDFVLNEVRKFKHGRLHYQPIIWNLLMFQMWFHKWMK